MSLLRANKVSDVVHTITVQDSTKYQNDSFVDFTNFIGEPQRSIMNKFGNSKIVECNQMLPYNKDYYSGWKHNIKLSGWSHETLWKICSSESFLKSNDKWRCYRNCMPSTKTPTARAVVLLKEIQSAGDRANYPNS
ncbi:hypothetical protein GJ496_008246 [Pomphorhynchus laevis]|nr:hypothetical protein GJ496_008246 [Pomphorhynchus laevis]